MLNPNYIPVNPAPHLPCVQWHIKAKNWQCRLCGAHVQEVQDPHFRSKQHQKWMRSYGPINYYGKDDEYLDLSINTNGQAQVPQPAVQNQVGASAATYEQAAPPPVAQNQAGASAVTNGQAQALTQQPAPMTTAPSTQPPPPPGPPPTVTAEAVGEGQVQLRILLARQDAFDLLRSLTRVLLGRPDLSPSAEDGTPSLTVDDGPTGPTPGVVVQCPVSSVDLLGLVNQGGPVP